MAALSPRSICRGLFNQKIVSAWCTDLRSDQILLEHQKFLKDHRQGTALETLKSRSAESSAIEIRRSNDPQSSTETDSEIEIRDHNENEASSDQLEGGKQICVQSPHLAFYQ